ncbi:GGDEF domain-containing protein [Arcobacter roscoffensis]|uniref:EAL domain-containing protein n=1 Tax=Arcobacter roscoffensis TaxID=2961520 RepID=A0ABY5EAQ3_9BACT|nr:EAL domain-containing protein [Arcobacter roscoffensis]UTJ07805.1 EAL domain-containing protein [Arcobacter roscoffensis]
MKKTMNKYTNNNIRNTSILSVIFIVLFLSSSYLFYKNYKDNLVERTKNSFQLNLNYLNNYFEDNILVKRENTLLEIDKSVDLKLFKQIKVDYNRFIFDKNSLVDSVANFDDKSWKMTETLVDANFGFIQEVEGSSYFEFIPSNNFEQNQALQIRFQLYKKGEIQNFLTQINFSNLEMKKTMDGDKFFSFVSTLIDLDFSSKVYDLVIDDIKVATITYGLNSYFVKKELQDFLLKLILFTFVMTFPIIFVIAFYHRYVFKKYVNEPIIYLNKHLDKIINNKFATIEKNKFEGTPQIVELTQKVSKMSSKIAALTNELNMNKESLELKVSTDTLTGLPNKKIFDFDLKNMFITSTSGYVFIIKIDGLATISKKHDSGYINNFIEHYSSVIKNTIYSHSKSDNKIYRFYGSQFAVISKNIDDKEAQEISQALVDDIVSKMSSGFDVPDELVQVGATSIDLYGTIESVLNSANEAYDKSKQLGNNKAYIITEKDVSKNYEKIDSNVKEIISESKFDISFVLDTYSFDKPDEIIMKELAPQLFDHNGEKLLIGSFVSVAEKLGVIKEFDKQVVEKAVEYIKNTNCNFEIAVNLSFSTIKDNSFIKWLEEYSLENKEVINKVVFSITAYSAFLHKIDFIRFVNTCSEMNLKTILKRYKNEDYPLEQLEKLAITYIRMHKDYTTGFANDVVKKHKVKNTLIFGQLNNINIIADSVKLDLDYELLDRLGAYGTSK